MLRLLPAVVHRGSAMEGWGVGEGQPIEAEEEEHDVTSFYRTWQWEACARTTDMSIVPGIRTAAFAVDGSVAGKPICSAHDGRGYHPYL